MARKKRLLWQIYPSYFFILLISVLAVSWHGISAFSDFRLKKTADCLEARALLVEDRLLGDMDPPRPEKIDKLCKRLGNRISTRITVALSSGEVIGDSHENPDFMNDFTDHKEISPALAGKKGMDRRYSSVHEKEAVYVALPLKEGDEVIGVVRTSAAMSTSEAALTSLLSRIVLTGILLAFLAAGLGLLVSQRISRPLKSVGKGLERFAQGDLSYRLSAPESKEMAGLADAMNRMGEDLDTRIKALTRQRNELEAVLSSMVEGVIAVDTDQYVLRINLAAAEMLGVNAFKAKRKSIQEVVRNSVLQDFVREALAGSGLVEKEIIIHDRGARILNGHGTALTDEQGGRIGALLVLNDVTRLRRLEAVRRDFVANVSHELKTPVTNIKGFVETLQGGMLDDRTEAERFLEIVERHVNRLNAIIDDLLSLSRVEQDSQRETMQFEMASVNDVVLSAIDSCRAEAEAKEIKILFSPDNGPRAQINPPLLEQALMNLISNAVKYSDHGSEIRIEVLKKGTEVLVAIEDDGCGIAKRHLPRIFERFYRVDKARSREMGGTGLGLAIVKHIAEAHGGQVTAESSPGKGSRFQIHLPRV